MNLIKRNPQYLRPYCKNCKLIYSLIKNISLRNCTQCGKPLKLKSFNPYPYFFLGIVIFLISATTLIVSYMPIIWIGGFIWGISLMVKSFDNWNKIKDLDKF